jgi:symplekin
MRPTWDTLVQCKTRILELLWSPTVSVGVKLSAVKFLQRVILVQTRGVSDPRVVFRSLSSITHLTFDLQYTLNLGNLQLQNKNDPNISFCPADHPFMSVPALEAEGKQMLEASLSLLYTSQ